MGKLSTSSSSHSHLLRPFPLWFLSALRAAKIKGKGAFGMLKQVRHLLASFVKAKLSSAKSKMNAAKTQLIIFSLLHNRKVLMSAISDKIHTQMSRLDKDEDGAATTNENGKMIVQYINAPSLNESQPPAAGAEMVVYSSTGRERFIEEDDEEVDHYPDLSDHSCFDDVFGDDGAGSAVEMVKNYPREDQGEFVLDAEIDQLAELFIKRFHRQMMMQETTPERGA